MRLNMDWLIRPSWNGMKQIRTRPWRGSARKRRCARDAALVVRSGLKIALPMSVTSSGALDVKCWSRNVQMSSRTTAVSAVSRWALSAGPQREST